MYGCIGEKKGGASKTICSVVLIDCFVVLCRDTAFASTDWPFAHYCLCVCDILVACHFHFIFFLFLREELALIIQFFFSFLMVCLLFCFLLVMYAMSRFSLLFSSLFFLNPVTPRPLIKRKVPVQIE